MTVPVQTGENSYTANGATSVFPYTFKILDQSHLKVYKDGVLQLSGYAVSGVGNNSGGNVTFSVNPLGGTNVKLERQLPVDQQLDLGEYTKFPAESVERQFDRLAMIDEQQTRESRGLREEFEEFADNTATRLDEVEQNIATNTDDIALLQQAIDAAIPDSALALALAAPNSNAIINGLAAKYISRVVLASYFATPNVTTDQSAQLQAAWQFAADNKIPFVVDGVYWVGLNEFNPPTIGANRPTALHVVSNSEVYFTPSAAIKLLPNAEPVHYVLNFYTAQNVKIYNPVVYGDRFTHTGVGGESGNCYNIVTCKNIYLHKPKAYDAWGDGFYIGREFFTNIPDPVEFVTLFEPEGYNSSRNDISLCHGHDINIIRPHTEGTFRTAPGAGIDIEPEYGDNAAVEPTLKRVVIESPKSIGKVAGLEMAFFRQIGDWDVSITGCAVDYNSSTPLLLLRSEAATGSQGVLTIENLKSFNCFGNPMVYNWFADGKCFVDIGSFTHSRANRPNDPAYRHAIEISRDGSTSGDLSIQRVINAGSPNCLEPFRVSDATTLQNTKIDFISQGRSNNGGVVSATALIDRSCKLNTERRNLSLTGLSSQTFFNTDYDVNTSGGNVSFEVSGNVRQTQTFEKVASANSLTLTASPGKAIIKPDGSVVSSYSATSLYSYIELQDDGSGNKIVINQRGNWA